jgi:hypothetical protein
MEKSHPQNYTKDDELNPKATVCGIPWVQQSVLSKPMKESC